MTSVKDVSLTLVCPDEFAHLLHGPLKFTCIQIPSMFSKTFFLKVIKSKDYVVNIYQTTKFGTCPTPSLRYMQIANKMLLKSWFLYLILSSKFHYLKKNNGYDSLENSGE